MGAGPVVVVDELRQHALQVPAAEDQEVVQALAPRCADKSLGHGVRPRRSEGQTHDFDTLAAEDLVESGRELGIAIAEQELLGSKLALLQLPGQVARLLDHPSLVGAVGAAGEVNSTAADLDEEENVEPGQPDRVHQEEVTGQHLVGVLADELAPGALAATGSRRQVVATEHLADGEVGASITELEQLARDATVAPAFVLPGEPQDELVEIAAGSRSLAPRSPPVGGPLTADQLSVPAEQGLRPGQECLPVLPGQKAADGGQQETISRLPAWPANLSLKDTELVTKGENLGFEPGLGPVAHDQDLQQEVDDGVDECEEHGRGIIAQSLEALVEA